MKARLFSTICLLFIGAASSACGSSDGQVDDEPVAVSESALSREALKPYFLYWFIAENSNKVEAVWAFHNPLTQSFNVTNIRIRDFTIYTWQIPTLVPVPAHTDVVPGFFWILDY